MKKNMRKRNQYIQALSTNKLLKDLEVDQIETILDDLNVEKWPKNTCSLHKTNTFHRQFHFIISGRLKVYKIDPESGREFTLFLLTRNDVFDMMCLLNECDQHVYYETLDKTILLAASLEKMQMWMKEYPEINRNILPYLCHQLRVVEEYATNLTLTEIPVRLAKLILRNINSESQKLELINDLSNEEIANMIGTTRAVVNRHLQEFKNDGTLLLGRQKMEIKNLQKLLRKAGPNL
ncbi:Crp/Fnr family transcriptional regulator [Salinimicrobium flavum]|uniref:Crp/Fnr family transcriptional regulator n=1 Tax=Salinimicrobium flavum TaxID=1737065 RepID=A0ABW5J2J1_9FLAO